MHLHSQHNIIYTYFKYPYNKLYKILINKYLSPSNIYLITNPHHNHSIRSTPKNHLMTLKLITDQTNNQLNNFNKNIIQIYLYLKKIKTFTKIKLFNVILKKYFKILKYTKKTTLSYTL